MQEPTNRDILTAVLALGTDLALFKTETMARFATIDTTLAQHGQALLELRADVDALKIDVSILKDDVSALKADVKALKADVEILKADVSALKADFGNLKVEVGTLERDLGSLTATVGRIERRQIAETASLDDHEARIKALEVPR